MIAVAVVALVAPSASQRALAEDIGATPPPPAPPTGNSIIFVKHPQTGTFVAAPAGPVADPFLVYRNSIGFPTPGFQQLGGNLFRWDANGSVTNLTNRAAGAVRHPEISFDGTRVLFAMKVSLTAKWQIYEMAVDGTGERRVSRDAQHNDLDPAYLPDGRIVFTSDRQRFIDPYTQWPSAQLHLMSADGSGVVQLSSNPGGDFSPNVTSTGGVSFTRWDVKVAGIAPPQSLAVSRFQLWTMTPDGESNAHPAFGAHTLSDFGGGYLQARDTGNGSGRFVATATTDPFLNGAGALVILSTAGDQDLHAPAFITDPRAYTTLDPLHHWRDPYPTSQGDLLASRADPVSTPLSTGLLVAPTPSNFAIVRVNLDGTGARVIYDDPAFSEWEPVEVTPRSVPPVIETTRDLSVEWGILNTLDVTLRGANPSVASPDRQPEIAAQPGLKVRIYQGERLGVDRWGIFTGYRTPLPTVIGDARVRDDGSFAARLRANVPIAWEVRDAGGRLLVQDRFWNQVLPGQTQTCNGCHSPHSGEQGRTSNLALAAPTEILGSDPRLQMATAAIDATTEVVNDARTLVEELRAAALSSRGMEKRLDGVERLLGRSTRVLERSREKKALRLAELAGRRGLSLRRKARKKLGRAD